MSDLAPFVAAAIESKVVADLKEETERLRLEVKEANADRDASMRSARAVGGRLEITGEGGAQVFASASIERAVEFVGELEDHIVFALVLDYEGACPASKLLSAEIRVNGALVAHIGDCDEKKEKYVEDWAGFGQDLTSYSFKTGRGTPWDKGFSFEVGQSEEDEECVEFGNVFFQVSHANVNKDDLLYRFRNNWT